MSNIAKSRHEVLVSSLGDPIQAGRVTARFADIVRDSVVADMRSGSLRHMTAQEVQRRTAILYDCFMLLRAECGYSTTHALDALPVALRARLDGVDWTPAPADRAWGG
jgi:hypothetical protein